MERWTRRMIRYRWAVAAVWIEDEFGQKTTGSFTIVARGEPAL